MTEETLDMDIEPDQLVVDENAVSEELINTSEVVVDEANPITITEANAVTSIITAASISNNNTGRYSTKQQFEVFLHNLVNCVNKELIDSAAIEFLLNLNTKNNRKKLTNTLFGVQRYNF